MARLEGVSNTTCGVELKLLVTFAFDGSVEDKRHVHTVSGQHQIMYESLYGRLGTREQGTVSGSDMSRVV